jgi:ABC-type amino acid transport substrate-binding protein
LRNAGDHDPHDYRRPLGPVLAALPAMSGGKTGMAKRRASVGLVGAIGAIVGALLATPAPASAEKLTLGNEGTNPPFSVLDASGTVGGMEPELAREMCKRMNGECDIVTMDLKALIPAMLQGKLDAVTTQLTPTAERKERALFTRMILQNNYRFVVPADSHYAYTKDGLKGVKIGLSRGGAGGRYITDTFGDAVVPLWYDNMNQVKLDLLAHRVDMTFGSEINWRLDLIDTPEGKGWKEDGESYWVGNPDVPPDERGLGWVVRKTDGQPLLDRMNAALTAIIDDCTYTKIRKKYVEFQILPAEAHCLKPSG